MKRNKKTIIKIEYAHFKRFILLNGKIKELRLKRMV